MRGKIVLTAFVVFGFVLAGCNTMAGMGRTCRGPATPSPTPPRSKPAAAAPALLDAASKKAP